MMMLGILGIVAALWSSRRDHGIRDVSTKKKKQPKILKTPRMSRKILTILVAFGSDARDSWNLSSTESVFNPDLPFKSLRLRFRTRKMLQILKMPSDDARDSWNRCSHRSETRGEIEESEQPPNPKKNNNNNNNNNNRWFPRFLGCHARFSENCEPVSRKTKMILKNRIKSRKIQCHATTRSDRNQTKQNTTIKRAKWNQIDKKRNKRKTTR